jgi:hypothetical protein
VIRPTRAAVVIKKADKKYKKADRLMEASSGISLVFPASALKMEETATITPAIPIQKERVGFSKETLFFFRDSTIFTLTATIKNNVIKHAFMITELTST